MKVEKMDRAGSADDNDQRFVSQPLCTLDFPLRWSW